MMLNNSGELFYVVSRTYKHQLLYKSRQIKHNWLGRPIKEDPWNKFPWHKIPDNTRRKKIWRKVLQKSFRQKVRNLINKGEYNSLPKRPLRYAWFVW